MYGKGCSHVYVLPSTLAKFRADVRNSDKRDAGKEAEKVMKTNWLELLLEIGSLTSAETGFSKMGLFLEWRQK
jgi:hypothetical protein